MEERTEMEKLRVLICDDSVAVQESLSSYLAAEGIDSFSVSDGESAVREIGRRAYDFVILDIMLPGIDGLETCSRIRKVADVPIMMLSAKGEEEDRVAGLENGADDYVTKPFSPREIAMRIRTILRRTNPVEKHFLQAEELKLDLDSREAYISDERIELTPREFDILCYFVQNKGKVLTRDQILDAVWGIDFYGNMRAVDTQVKRLRTRITVPNVHFSISAEYGIGYKFEEAK
jgi:DNA-binding response OmpR family regulator